jgi:hypothetical protein
LKINRDHNKKILKRRGRPVNVVYQHIIDLIFPFTKLENKAINTKEGRAIRAKKKLNKKAVSN